MRRTFGPSLGSVHEGEDCVVEVMSASAVMASIASIVRGG